MEERDFLAEYQPLVFSQLKKSVKHGRLAHAYLFEGDQGTGKAAMSRWLAKRLFCTDLQDDEPCNRCNNCRRIEQGEHPDVQIIQPEGQTIKVDQIRQLQAEFSKSGFESRQQVFIIQDADKMNASAANSLLKFLEEPPGSFLALLETDALGRILPTIQSRCQIIHFLPLAPEHLIEKLVKDGIGKESAQLLASLTNGYQKAVEIYQNEWFNGAKDTVMQWFTYLEKRDPQAFIYVQKRILPLAKEKEQQRLLLQMLLFYYRIKRDRSTESATESTRILELLLQAEQKLTANVSFQNVAEQLALRIIYQK
ncbi:DNA polymerase III subunit delta' [Enterococcus mediterraneensis]|uniref:DNA polymerase III subunit delta' n=1 Tax=Enterococcus mediterraneensis TaxID=2364791 RepID=UPI000F0468B6|nr:DNA polymerase III subunit delta' [Enterococcus mediterraneensis]